MYAAEIFHLEFFCQYHFSYFDKIYIFPIVVCCSKYFAFTFSAALKTQPYDLLRWSAAYFRCLSMDILPPVKPRYEQENMFGCLTKGYLKVLLSQVGVVLTIPFRKKSALPEILNYL